MSRQISILTELQMEETSCGSREWDFMTNLYEEAGFLSCWYDIIRSQ